MSRATARGRASILALALSLVVAVAPAASPTTSPGVAFTSDDFNTSGLAAHWSVVDPVGDGSVSMRGVGSGQAVVELSVPAGVSHDPWGSNDSLRVVQTAGDVDFEVEVAFDSVPSAKYQMQGLLIEQDADDWLRFDVYHDGSRLRAFAAGTTGGTSGAELSQRITATETAALRVRRAGDTWTMQVASDGGAFAAVGSFTRALGVTAVGPFAGNHHTSTSSVPAYTARVDYVFDTTAPVVPEDDAEVAASYRVSTSVEGSGSIEVSPEQSSYPEGTEVSLTAVPAGGWAFEAWGGDLTGTGNPGTLVVSGDHHVSATFTADLTPPVITDVTVSTTDTGARVTWTTDEPATSAVSYGTSTAYEQGTVEDTALSTSHSITLQGLQAATTYHYQVRSTDAGANTAITDDGTFTTGADSRPVIDVWDGLERWFGSPGRSQVWVNILGNVSDPDGLASLSFRLNGGPSRGLSIGPDNRRLSEPGDFNIEIGYDELIAGSNEIRITADDQLDNTSLATVVVHYERGRQTPIPYSVDWGARPIDLLAQIVDGRWSTSDGILRTMQPGYDRLVTIGDLSWQNYELRVPVTVHAFGAGAYSHLSGDPLMGIALRWQGHSRRNIEDISQPRYWWWPTGAFAWYRWDETTPKIELIGNDGSPTIRRSLPMIFDTTYTIRVQVQDTTTGTAYRFKLWPISETEPATWIVDIEDENSPATGGIALIAHHVDVSFGRVSVTPLSGNDL